MWSDNDIVDIKIINVKRGRGLIAKKDIKAGDTILTDLPIASAQYSWNKFYKYLSCDHCMKPLETAEENCQRLTNNPALTLPHPECCVIHKETQVICSKCKVTYCSEQCQKLAYDHYHKTLCHGENVNNPEHPLNKLEEFWRYEKMNIHFPPETSSIMLILRIIATVFQVENKQLFLQNLSQFCSFPINEQEEIAHKLLGPQFQEQLEYLRCSIKEYIFVEELSEIYTPAGFRSLIALIGMNGQGIGTSSLSAWVKNCDELVLPDGERQHLDALIDKLYEDIEKESGSFLNCEGSGLYAMQSACNHSCSPNAEVCFPFNDFRLSIDALRDIKAGEEILICYINECQRDRSRHSRQKYLRENYLFTCDCSKCVSQAGEPDVTSEEDESDDDDEPMGD